MERSCEDGPQVGRIRRRRGGIFRLGRCGDVLYDTNSRTRKFLVLCIPDDVGMGDLFGILSYLLLDGTSHESWDREQMYSRPKFDQPSLTGLTLGIIY